MARFWAAVSCALLPLGAWAQLPPPAQPPLPLSVEPPPEAIIAPPAEDSAAIDLALPDLAQVQVLAIDPDRLFAASAWGQRAQALLAELGDEIAAENERLERQFTEEEQALTAARAALAPAEFRRRAEAFDTRAQDVRRDRAEALRALAERAEAERTAFIEA
ncbi:MAG: OmpH family outer membrane protein, partial [Paracoccus sp. (in: a-proteobacteria)]|nr:OmpH family outer membrane protein [Paracoccus sp. (in: a-proteobacteria)]